MNMYIGCLICSKELEFYTILKQGEKPILKDEGYDEKNTCNRWNCICE